MLPTLLYFIITRSGQHTRHYLELEIVNRFATFIGNIQKNKSVLLK